MSVTHSLSRLASHALRLEGVGRRFGALVALHGVSLEVAPGERRAIIGANGAGKTTLFNTVTGDVPPTAGRIFFFGEEITGLPPHERIRRGLRRTYQSSMLFMGLTVTENLYLAARGITRGRLSPRRPASRDPALERARELARSVHLDAVGDRPVAELSHGQKRQLEIGMALVGAPRLILFDEPAAGLSPGERRDLLALLRALPPHVGFVVIEHDLDIALAVAERVTVMHEGAIFKQGTPAEIEVDADVQAIYLGSTRKGHSLPPGAVPRIARPDVAPGVELQRPEAERRTGAEPGARRWGWRRSSRGSLMTTSQGSAP